MERKNLLGRFDATFYLARKTVIRHCQHAYFHSAYHGYNKFSEHLVKDVAVSFGVDILQPVYIGVGIRGEYALAYRLM